MKGLYSWFMLCRMQRSVTVAVQRKMPTTMPMPRPIPMPRQMIFCKSGVRVIRFGFEMTVRLCSVGRFVVV